MVRIMALALSGGGLELGGGGGAKLRYALAQAGKFVVGERALRLDGGQQQLLDRARRPAGYDKAHGRADAAEVVRAPVRQRQRVHCAFATQPRHSALDFVDAAIELGGEALSHGRKALGE
jgi:hypothetical protein